MSFHIFFFVKKYCFSINDNWEKCQFHYINLFMFFNLVRNCLLLWFLENFYPYYLTNFFSPFLYKIPTNSFCFLSPFLTLTVMSRFFPHHRWTTQFPLTISSDGEMIWAKLQELPYFMCYATGKSFVFLNIITFSHGSHSCLNFEPHR